MISSGTPNLGIQCQTKAAVHVAAVTSLIGIASGHLENLSTIVIRYRWSSEGGSGPTKSRCRLPNLLSAGLYVTTGALVWRATFEA